jgi:hypothetical protein
VTATAVNGHTVVTDEPTAFDLGNRVQWNPTADVWLSGTVAGVLSDNAWIVLDDQLQGLTVSAKQKHLRHLDTVRALTVRQPWAWAIAKGHKGVENRSRPVSYRGPLAIHAAKQWDDSGIEALREVVHQVRAQGGTLPPSLRKDGPHSGFGVVIAVVDLVDVCVDGRWDDCDCGPWARPGQTHWKLTNPRLLDPFPATGRLGLWEVEVPRA